MITPTQFTVHRRGDNPIFADTLIKVSLDDESAGYFVRLTDAEGNSISLDFSEVEEIFSAINQLKAISQVLEV
jgi:hypothetical protein